MEYGVQWNKIHPNANARELDFGLIKSLKSSLLEDDPINVPYKKDPSKGRKSN